MPSIACIACKVVPSLRSAHQPEFSLSRYSFWLELTLHQCMPEGLGARGAGSFSWRFRVWGLGFTVWGRETSFKKGFRV